MAIIASKDFFYPWQFFTIGHYFSWILKTHSYMTTLRKKCIQSNHLDLLLRGGRGGGVFYHGLATSQVYGLKQSPHAWFDRFHTVVQQFGMSMTCSEADHSIFYCRSTQGCIYLIIYVDAIVIIGSELGIVHMKQYLSSKFQTKDFGKLQYFLGIKVGQSKYGLVISQRKYAFGILEETILLNAKLVDTLMHPSIKLIPNQGEPLSDLSRYRRLVGWFQCLQ